MKLKCRYQERDLKNHRGEYLACYSCQGIDFDPPHVRLITQDKASPPRRTMRIYYQGKRVGGFNCPATIPSPLKSKLVEKE